MTRTQARNAAALRLEPNHRRGRPGAVTPGSSAARIGLIVVAVALRIPLLFTPLTYLNDAWREADTAGIARHLFRNGFHLLYPQIYWGGNGPGYVESEFQVYPAVVATLYEMLGEHVWLGRVVSLLCYAAALLLLDAWARRELQPRAAWWALAFFAVCPLTVRYSIAFMPEALWLLLYVGALYGVSRWLADGRRAYLWSATACLGLAIAIKPTALIAGLILLPVVLRRRGLAVFGAGEVWLAAGACVFPGLLWYIHAHELYVQYGNTFGVAAGGDTKWGDASYWSSGGFYVETVWLHIKWVFAVGGAVAFAAGLVRALQRRGPEVVVSGSAAALVYCLVLARAVEKEYSVHYYLPFVPIAALGVGLGMDWLLSAGARGSAARLAAGWACAAVALASSATLYAGHFRGSANAWAGTEVACAQRVHALVPADARSIFVSRTPGREHGRPRVYQDPIMLFHADRYGWSLPADGCTAAAVEQLRHRGARYLIVSRAQCQRLRELSDYLSTRAEEVDPGGGACCGIYYFPEEMAARPQALEDSAGPTSRDATPGGQSAAAERPAFLLAN